MGLNQITIIGNVGSDPEVRYLESGGAVGTFSVAVTESYNNKNGERIDSTEWFRIEVWEGLAKIAEKYVKKGNQIFIQGKIKTDEWTDREGNKRSSIKVRASQLTLLGGKAELPANGITNGPSAAQQRAEQGPPTNTQRKPDPIPPSLQAEGDDDDLPF